MSLLRAKLYPLLWTFSASPAARWACLTSSLTPSQRAERKSTHTRNAKVRTEEIYYVFIKNDKSKTEKWGPGKVLSRTWRNRNGKMLSCWKFEINLNVFFWSWTRTIKSPFTIILSDEKGIFLSFFLCSLSKAIPNRLYQSEVNKNICRKRFLVHFMKRP